MKNKTIALLGLMFLVVFNFHFATVHAQGTAFTYQGRLNGASGPVSGSYDLTFTLFKTNVTGIGIGPITNTAVSVTNGLFTTTLDFHGIPDGIPYYLELAVRTNGAGAFTTLAPRQALTPSFYAMYANTASNALNVTGFVQSSQLFGTIPVALLNGSYTNPLTFSNPGNSINGIFNGNGLGLTNVTAVGFLGALAGDVTGTQGATVVTQVGGLSAGYVTTGVALANGATSANVNKTIVERDGSGNFSAGTITASFAGNGTGVTNVTAIGFTGALAGDVTGTQGATIVAQVGGQSATNVASGTILANGATNANLTKTIVERDGSGGFSAGTITASFVGNGAGLTNLSIATVPVGMVLIPAGTFTMGDSLDGLSDATPTNITVSAFYLDANLVTFSQWRSVYYWATNHGYSFTNAGDGEAANHPVHTVDWFDCVKWCNARSQQAGRTPVYYTDAGYTQLYTNLESYTVYASPTANGFRLPTEAEWEKAARGGLSGQRFPWGNIIDENLANYYGVAGGYDAGPSGYNSIGSAGGGPPTSPVGSFAPNGFGLYDMAGNVFEWCWDWYGTPYGQPSDTNPTGPTTGSNRIFRGGYFASIASYARCANRSSGFPSASQSPNIGFRCVRGL